MTLQKETLEREEKFMSVTSMPTLQADDEEGDAPKVSNKVDGI